MKTKEKIMGGAVVLLLAITLLPIQTVWAGVEVGDYLRGKISATKDYISSTYHNAQGYYDSAKSYIPSYSNIVLRAAKIYANPIGTTRGIVTGLTRGLDVGTRPQTAFERSGALIGVTYATTTNVTKIPNNSTNESKNATIGNKSFGGPNYANFYRQKQEIYRRSILDK